MTSANYVAKLEGEHLIDIEKRIDFLKKHARIK